MSRLGVTRELVTTGLALALTSFMVFPIYWLLVTSLRAPADLELSNAILPLPPYFEGYAEILRQPEMLRYLMNSVIYGVAATALTAVLAIPAAYALARLPIRFKTSSLFFFLVLQTFPAIMLATPLFVMFSGLGLVNYRITVIIAITTKTLPMAIVMLRPYFQGLPRDLEDAATVDGCSRLGALWRIILPLCLPGVVTVAAFNFLSGWGDMIFSLTLLTDDTLRPISLGLYRYMGQYGIDWNQLMAASVIAAVPAVAVFFFAQRYLVSGLAAGSVNE